MGITSPCSVTATVFHCLWIRALFPGRKNGMDRGGRYKTGKRHKKETVFSRAWPLLRPQYHEALLRGGGLHKGWELSSSAAPRRLCKYWQHSQRGEFQQRHPCFYSFDNFSHSTKGKEKSWKAKPVRTCHFPWGRSLPWFSSSRSGSMAWHCP